MLLQLLREPKAGEKPVPTVVERLKQYLEAHSRERITADSLGRMFGYHPFYLNRLFTSMRTRPFIFTRCSAASAMPACCWLRPI